MNMADSTNTRKNTAPLLRIVKRAEMSAGKVALLSAVGLLAGIVVGGLFILMLGQNPFAVYAAIAKGAFRSSLATKGVVKIAVPLLISSLGSVLAFKMKFWYIGAEGQILIGGIVSGVFTATEGAGIAVLYCLILSIIYKSIDFKGFLGILLNSAKTSGIILFLISASSAMSFVMAYSGIPAAISNGLMSLTENKYIIFLLMNIILLVIGMFMDITPAILIFTPIFLPIATSFGMTEIQFGVMLIFNMCLGNITPPVGSVLFVGCGIGHVSIEQVTSKLIPYFVALVLALLAVTYIPALSLGLPSLMGLI